MEGKLYRFAGVFLEFCKQRLNVNRAPLNLTIEKNLITKFLPTNCSSYAIYLYLTLGANRRKVFLTLWRPDSYQLPSLRVNLVGKFFSKATKWVATRYFHLHSSNWYLLYTYNRLLKVSLRTIAQKRILYFISHIFHTVSEVVWHSTCSSPPGNGWACNVRCVWFRCANMKAKWPRVLCCAGVRSILPCCCSCARVWGGGVWNKTISPGCF